MRFSPGRYSVTQNVRVKWESWNKLFCSSITQVWRRTLRKHSVQYLSGTLRLFCWLFCLYLFSQESMFKTSYKKKCVSLHFRSCKWGMVWGWRRITKEPTCCPPPPHAPLGPRGTSTLAGSGVGIGAGLKVLSWWLIFCFTSWRRHVEEQREKERGILKQALHSAWSVRAWSYNPMIVTWA